MIIYGVIGFGSAMAFLTIYAFPLFPQLTWPGTLIPIVACLLMGACWGEAMWQIWQRLPWSMKGVSRLDDV